MLYIGGFLACAIVIFFAGSKLSYYGNLISEKTGLGKAWIGLILMATVTSMPELMVGISSSAIIGSADLAVGDVLGSCAFNLFILAMLDAFIPRHNPLFSTASQNHVLTAALGTILIALAGIALFLPNEIVIMSWIGITSIIFVIIYLVSIRLIFINEKKLNKGNGVTIDNTDSAGNISMGKIAGRYILYATIIIIAALALPFFAEKIAELTGLSTSFVGSLFLAISTSLPEIAVSIAAVRMGSIDLAVGGLLGSNIFNVLILAIDDLFYTKGPILKQASDLHIASVFSVIIMSAIVIIGLTFRSVRKRYFLAWDAALILLVYIINIILLYYIS